MTLSQRVAQATGLSDKRVSACINLLDDGATLPFIARYRKEVTGSLNEIDIQKIIETKAQIEDLDKRRETILTEISAQDKLSASLEKKINSALTKQELEDLYLPYKPKRTTRATKAIDAGLQPVALAIQNYRGADSNFWKASINKKSLALAGFTTDAEILAGVSDILAAQMAEVASIRSSLRRIMERGSIESTVTKDHKESATPFTDYYDKTLSIGPLKSHTILALLRGEKEKILRLRFTFETAQIIATIRRTISPVQQTPFSAFFTTIAEDTLKRLLRPSIEKELRTTLKERADNDAIAIFQKNLETILLAPPAGSKPVIAIDPGFRTGCKVVVLDETGRFITNETIYPTEPRKDTAGASKRLLSLVNQYKPAYMAIGNGTGGRETEQFVKESVVPTANHAFVPVLVNEAGASIYSASPIAVDEFPDLDITVRGAISIGRRLQDPLVELVKIDPKSIGVGQYQHDVNQKQLKASLDQAIEAVVNRVGVNLNLASEPLLSYVAGISAKTAKEIVTQRNEIGSFAKRIDLKKVKGLGPKAFEQCAGFLRIAGGPNRLDNSGVHPESYDLVKSMAKSLNLTADQLLQQPDLVQKLSPTDFVDAKRGVPTITDIFDEIQQPGRDPRDEFTYATFDDAINSPEDLIPDMQLEGVVTNVTAFGAFVDIGVHQDGLVHISQLADRFVSNPADIVSTGDIVTVRVMDVDLQRKRISLSMKNLS